MADRISITARSENMRRIRSGHTVPELTVRKLVRDLGFTGYRLHRKELPGKPDLAWIGKKKAIFVNGCFWHGHECKEGIRKPKSNQPYWLPKIEKNKLRDQRNQADLQKSGWLVEVVWECELKDESLVKERLAGFLSE
ncbi:DNA mismatch endonuclease Vsr [uncultured Ferrovibrio sp.]|uniref:very short patch repair endonuclease n=1 Tax=uncultured Ferrovibrio sp. TaxID=1576913 RepID=UPI00260E6BA7|nr:DNA mismatch endonuclease Vsr [uncultured Ferrovibrio sp.]